MNQVISALKPAWAVPGAVVAIDGVHLPVPADGPPHVLVGAADAQVTAASHRTLRILVPADAEGGTAAVRIDELPGETVYLQVAGVLVSGVHQVDNPAFGKDGLLYCTVSGGRSTKAAVPLYRVNREGAREPIAIELPNPTSLAVGPDGRLYVSSRFDGIVYRVLDDDRVEIYATELGTATGLAFGSDGSLFVGDRSGSILRVSPDRQVETWASIPSSVAAFHLAMGPRRLSLRRGADDGHARCDLSRDARSPRRHGVFRLRPPAGISLRFRRIAVRRRRPRGFGRLVSSGCEPSERPA
jgi:hypothetical protein